MFIDELTIKVRSGSGGSGCASHNHRPDRKRVPDGGDGGRGGHVFVRADDQTGSLFHLKAKRVFESTHGGLGQSNKKAGHNGKDFVVKVPCGTTVFNKSDNLLIRDLVNPGDEVCVLKGGQGGFGNQGGRETTQGGRSQELELFLSFKMPVDIAIVGLPNSGKTLFLKEVTGAGVKEEAYPFATRAPQLGTYATVSNAYRFCELPALYGTSHEGGGLGNHYLKHLERAHVIMFMVDVASQFAPDVETGFKTLFDAIGHYDKVYLDKPKLLVVNKVDLAEDKKSSIPSKFEGEKVHQISALEKLHLKRFLSAAEKIVGKSYATAT